MSQQPDPQPSVSGRHWGASVAIVAAVVWTAFYVALRAGSQFFADDFLYLQVGARSHITLPWLAVDSYGHFAPVFRLIYAFVARAGGVSWPLAAGVLATLDALIFVSLAWLTTLLLGRRPIALVLALAGATSIPALRTSLWMASGVQVLGGAFCMSLCTAAFVAYMKHRRVPLLVASLSALSLGLVWYERPVLTIGYLVLIRYLFFPPSVRRPARRLVRGEATLWAPYVAVVTIYLWYRLFIFNSHPEPGNKSAAVKLLLNGIAHSYLPSLVGVRESQSSGWGDPATIAGLIALAGLFAVLASVRRGVWRCGVFLVATYGANVAVQAAGRLGTGADPVLLSRDLQYFVDPYVATTMAVALAGALPRRKIAGVGGRLVTAVAMVAAATVALTTMRSWHAVTEDNAQTYAHGYLDSALHQLTTAGNVDLVSLRVPIQVAPPFIAPFNDQRRFFDIDHALTQRFDSGSARKVVITAQGIVAPVHPVTGALIDSRSLTATGGVSLEADRGSTCITAAAGAVLSVPIPAAAARSDLTAVQIAYSSTRSNKVLLATRTGSDNTFNQWPTKLPAGQATTTVTRLDGALGDSLELLLPKGAHGLCVQSVWVGSLAIDTPDGCQTIDQYGQPTGRRADCSAGWPAGA